MNRIAVASLFILLMLNLFGAACSSKDQPTPAAEAPKAAAVEDGFVSVFNGVDLTGWTGDVEGYAVEDGAIVCLKDGGGNLYIDKEYGDFHLRFAFKLEPGGNNGVGIRAEQGKDAAYYGMEIQVLDDTAAQYAELQPRQYHGSVYGVAAAERGHQKPVGQWNEEEIIARGSRITVRLNGAVIVTITSRSTSSGAGSTMLIVKLTFGMRSSRSFAAASACAAVPSCTATVRAA